MDVFNTLQLPRPMPGGSPLAFAVRHCALTGDAASIFREARSNEKNHRCDDRGLCFALTATSAAAQQTTGNIQGRSLTPRRPPCRVSPSPRKARPPGSRRPEVTDAEGVYRLSALPVGNYDVTPSSPGFPRTTQGNHRQRRLVASISTSTEVAGVSESVNVTAETPLIQTPTRRSAASSTPPDREPAAQRPPVREPGDDHPRRRPRLPLRPDQEHAVLAADQRRQRPQRQLPDRRRRQQRRHRRRPAAALPARGDPGVQLRHPALQGRVRPQQRRRDEHRHQERHQRSARQLVHAAPRQVDERGRPRPSS